MKWRKYEFEIEAAETYVTEVREHSPAEIRVTVRKHENKITDVFAINAGSKSNAELIAAGGDQQGAAEVGEATGGSASPRKARPVAFV